MNDLKFKVLSLKPVFRKKDYFRVTLDNGDKYNFHGNSITRYNIKENKSIENKVIHEALDYTEREILKVKLSCSFHIDKEAKRN